MRNKKHITIFAVLLILVISLGFIITDKFVPLYKSDNDTVLDFTNVTAYEKSEMDALQIAVLSQEWSLKQFIRRYRPQYIRKTDQGYYAVLPEENNALCFVFWDNKDKIYNFYQTGGFLSHDAVKNDIEIGKTNLHDITDGGSDFCYYPISKMALTGHICSDGVLIVKYDRDLIAESIEFFSNEELESSDDYLLQLTPYILPQDKR